MRCIGRAEGKGSAEQQTQVHFGIGPAGQLILEKEIEGNELVGRQGDIAGSVFGTIHRFAVEGITGYDLLSVAVDIGIVRGVGNFFPGLEQPYIKPGFCTLDEFPVQFQIDPRGITCTGIGRIVLNMHIINGIGVELVQLFEIGFYHKFEWSVPHLELLIHGQYIVYALLGFHIGM